MVITAIFPSKKAFNNFVIIQGFDIQVKNISYIIEQIYDIKNYFPECHLFTILNVFIADRVSVLR